MPEEKMIEIPYEDFVELTIMKGRVETTLDWLKIKSGTFTEDDVIVCLLTGKNE
jgi:hypothetical protein